MEKSERKLPDIVRTIMMDAPINKVWNAVATQEGLAAWLMPNDFKPVLGHKFTFVSQPKRDWDGIVHCEVKELSPPNRLGFSWEGSNLNQYVYFELREVSEQTEFTLVHAGWSEEHMELREVMYHGWGYITEGLREKIGERNGRYLS
jgi:uncharacterized protein YndB with AHSA1/START domain